MWRDGHFPSLNTVDTIDIFGGSENRSSFFINVHLGVLGRPCYRSRIRRPVVHGVLGIDQNFIALVFKKPLVWRLGPNSQNVEVTNHVFAGYRTGGLLSVRPTV